MHLLTRLSAGVAGGALLAGGLLVAQPAAAQAAPSVGVSVTNDTPATVDESTVQRSVTVTDEGTVDDVDVTIKAAKSDEGRSCPLTPKGSTSTFADEIYYRLTSPEGTTVRLVTSEFAADDDISTYDSTVGSNAVMTVAYDDGAATAAGPTYQSGTFRPAESLSTFDGEDAAGVWTLLVGDAQSGQPLCHESFTLDLTVAEPADTTAPTVTIDSGPDDGATVATAPEYGFSADEDGVTFECAVDPTDPVVDADFTDCESPETVDVTGLADGEHTFAVRATDLADNTGAPASRDFTLDTTGPTVSIDSGPDDGATVDQSPTYTFGSTDTDLGGFDCSVTDPDGFTVATPDCSSPFEAATSSPGTYTFSVSAFDTTGNPGPAAIRTFTLRDVACDDATTEFERVKAKMRAAKERVARARESGNRDRIDRAIAHKREVRQERIAAKAAFREACTPR